MSEDLVKQLNADEAPVVNLHVPGRDSHPVFCLIIQTLDGDRDPAPLPGSDGKPGDHTSADSAFPAMAFTNNGGTTRITLDQAREALALLQASSPLAYPFDRFCRDLPSASWKDGANYSCFKRLTVKCW